MPKLLERLKKSIQKKQWVPESEAIAYATSILQKNWYLDKHWELTARWRIKQRLPEWTKWLWKLTTLKNKLKKKYAIK